jgi:hypothetical protein
MDIQRQTHIGQLEEDLAKLKADYRELSKAARDVLALRGGDEENNALHELAEICQYPGY